MAGKRRGYTRSNFTKEEFDTIRKLLDAGLTRKQVTDIVGGRKNPIDVIDRNDIKSFEEYKQYRRDYRASRLAAKQAETETSVDAPVQTEPMPIEEVIEEIAKPSISIPVTSEENPVAIQLKRTNELLEQLVEAWNNKPTKRGLF